MTDPIPCPCGEDDCHEVCPHCAGTICACAMCCTCICLYDGDELKDTRP